MRERVARLITRWRENHPPLDYDARCHGAPDPMYGTVSCPCGADTGDECLHYQLGKQGSSPSQGVTDA